MKYLLDTHVWLWLQMVPERIPAATRSILEDAATRILLSSVTTWECAIKVPLGKLELPDALETMLRFSMEVDGMEPLAVTHEHTIELSRLPRHHSDPFDRLLVAQARAEQVALVTSDKSIARYDVAIQW